MLYRYTNIVVILRCCTFFVNLQGSIVSYSHAAIVVATAPVQPQPSVVGSVVVVGDNNDSHITIGDSMSTSVRICSSSSSSSVCTTTTLPIQPTRVLDHTDTTITTGSTSDTTTVTTTTCINQNTTATTTTTRGLRSIVTKWIRYRTNKNQRFWWLSYGKQQQQQKTENPVHNSSDKSNRQQRKQLQQQQLQQANSSLNQTILDQQHSINNQNNIQSIIKILLMIMMVVACICTLLLYMGFHPVQTSNLFQFLSLPWHFRSRRVHQQQQQEQKEEEQEEEMVGYDEAFEIKRVVDSNSIATQQQQPSYPTNNTKISRVNKKGNEEHSLLRDMSNTHDHNPDHDRVVDPLAMNHDSNLLLQQDEHLIQQNQQCHHHHHDSEKNVLQQMIHLVGVDCPICYCSFENNDFVTSCDDSHYCHTHCLYLWLDQSSTCPCCRQNMFHNNKKLILYHNTNNCGNENDPTNVNVCATITTDQHQQQQQQQHQYDTRTTHYVQKIRHERYTYQRNQRIRNRTIWRRILRFLVRTIRFIYILLSELSSYLGYYDR